MQFIVFRSIALELNKAALSAHESNDLQDAATLYGEALKALETCASVEATKIVSKEHEASLHKWRRIIENCSRDNTSKHEEDTHQTDVSSQSQTIRSCPSHAMIRATMQPISMEKYLACPIRVISTVIEHNMGVICFLSKHLDQAVDHFVKARAAQFVLGEKYSSILLSISCALGITYALLGKANDSLEALVMALTFRLKCKSSKNKIYAARLQNIGKFFGAMGNDCLAYMFFLGEILVSCEHQPLLDSGFRLSTPAAA